VARGKDPTTVRVGDVATPHVGYLSPDMDASDCLAAFERQKVRHLPVLEDGKPVGMLGLRDLLAYISAVVQRVMDSDAYRCALLEGWTPRDHRRSSAAH
jgi:signal-transduction protein with cAMP-binding, CBS, and nucleotidyltransferase domain